MFTKYIYIYISNMWEIYNPSCKSLQGIEVKRQPTKACPAVSILASKRLRRGAVTSFFPWGIGEKKDHFDSGKCLKWIPTCLKLNYHVLTYHDLSQRISTIWLWFDIFFAPWGTLLASNNLSQCRNSHWRRPQTSRRGDGQRDWPLVDSFTVVPATSWDAQCVFHEFVIIIAIWSHLPLKLSTCKLVIENDWKSFHYMWCISCTVLSGLGQACRFLVPRLVEAMNNKDRCGPATGTVGLNRNHRNHWAFSSFFGRFS